ncbi:hypothetical protein V8E51_013369 [Hyaloscypha variabilis]
MKSTSLLATLAVILATATAAPVTPREPALQAERGIDGPVYIQAGNRMVVTKAKRDLDDRSVIYVTAGNRMVLTRDTDSAE